MPKKHILCTNEAQTTAIARKLALFLKPGHVLGFCGPLGAGKTFFIKGLAQGLGVPDNQYVRSPTFTLMNSYEGKFPLHHIDLYRLDHLDDVIELGFEEVFDGNSVVCVEWFDKFREIMPPSYLEIRIVPTDEGRSILFLDHGLEWIEPLKCFL